MTEVSEIRNFYSGLHVLITGGTGFLGRILIEKLLRSTDVATIYILIREKREKSIPKRLEELWNHIIFQRLKSERPQFQHRVVGICGDCSIDGFGLTISDKQTLIDEVNVIFHVAACVKLDENLKSAYSINVNGTREIVHLGRQIKNLKSLIHVSTAYSNCYQDHIDEIIYDSGVDCNNINNILQKISEEEVEQITPRLIGKWPNTYTFTKAVVESLLKETANGLPVGIFRPSIIISTYEEPIAGWTNSFSGATGICAGITAGLLRVFIANDKLVTDLIPVDSCVAGLIAVAWDVANANLEKTSNNIPVYNYVSSVENSITLRELLCLTLDQDRSYPLSNSAWLANCSFITNKTLYKYLKIILHIIPALLMDFGALMCGKKAQQWATYKRIHKFCDILNYFTTREWTFTNTNVQTLWSKMNDADRKLFKLSIKETLWLEYFRNYVKGLRVYLLRDPLDTLDYAKTRRRRMLVMHALFKFFIQCSAVAVIWLLLRRIFSIFTS